MFLIGRRMLMGTVRDFVEFGLYSVSCDQPLTLWNLVRAVYKVSYWAVAFEPKTVLR